MNFSRREFMNGLTLAGVAGLVGMWPETAGAEPPPETTTLRLPKRPSVCQAPRYFAEDLLRSEGFTAVRYLEQGAAVAALEAVASGELDMTSNFIGPTIIRIDAGDAIVVLAGLHTGCFELFGISQVRTIRDLKGKTVAIPDLGSPEHVFLSSMMAHVGLDPRRDTTWITRSRTEAMQLLAEGKIDAYLGFPPDPQELRAKKIGHVLVNSNVDRPWSLYFCCMVVANRAFVRKHPVAAKRAVRAILKATDICALEPDRVARFLVDKGYTTQYDYTLQALKEIPYHRWRQYHPEDSVRFYALRLHEAGMIKSSPQKILAQGTDWRFLNELKKELKG